MGAYAVIKRCSDAVVMAKRTCEGLREATGANVRSWAALPQCRRSGCTCRERCAHVSPRRMGGARMGLDPKTSMLNKWNQLHACKNVFVTDGASMTSTSCQNPSLTYMALTARAADYAVSEMKKGSI